MSGARDAEDALDAFRTYLREHNLPVTAQRVAIAEAVDLATSLSTDDSPKFVNGLLARLAEVKPTLA